jgi:hypothetical protein
MASCKRLLSAQKTNTYNCHSSYIIQCHMQTNRAHACAAVGANIPVPSTNPPNKKTLFEAVAVMLQKDVDGGDALVAGHICHILFPDAGAFGLKAHRSCEEGSVSDCMQILNVLQTLCQITKHRGFK